MSEEEFTNLRMVLMSRMVRIITILVCIFEDLLVLCAQLLIVVGLLGVFLSRSQSAEVTESSQRLTGGILIKV